MSTLAEPISVDQASSLKSMTFGTVNHLAWRLTAVDVRSSGRALGMLSTIAFTVCTAFLLTVAGGTWAFYQRAIHPPTPQIAEIAAGYVPLSGIACALLVVPILALGAAAARLDASRREQRLASLRLLGATTGDVAWITVIQTSLRAGLGTICGLLIYLLTLPAWAMLPFQGGQLSVAEMLLPAPILLAGLVIVWLLGLGSTAIGLQRVSISPLGVVRNSNPAKVTWLRLLLGGLIIVGWLIASSMSQVLSQAVMIAVVLGFLAGIGFIIDLIGPLIVRSLAHLLAKSVRASTVVAARRMGDNARTTWRQASSLSFVAFIAAVTSALPTGQSPALGAMSWLQADISTGVQVTLAIAFAVAAIATGINQSALVYERAAQTLALEQMGFDAAFRSRARRIEVLSPILGAVLSALLLAAVFVTPMHLSLAASRTGVITFLVVLFSGLLLVVSATAISSRLEKRLVNAYPSRQRS